MRRRRACEQTIGRFRSGEGKRGGHGVFDFLEPVRRVTERSDNTSARGEQVRHMERVAIDGHGLADQTVLVIEAIESGHGRSECDMGIDRVHHESPWQAENAGETQFDDLGRGDLLCAGRSDYCCCRGALNLSLEAVAKRLRTLSPACQGRDLAVDIAISDPPPIYD